MQGKPVLNRFKPVFTCDASEKFGPGDRFLPPMGPEGPGFVTPFLFRRFAEARVVSEKRRRTLLKFSIENALAYFTIKLVNVVKLCFFFVVADGETK